MRFAQRKTDSKRMRTARKAVFAAALLGAGCGGEVVINSHGSRDSGTVPDSGKDAGVDSGVDPGKCTESGEPLDGGKLVHASFSDPISTVFFETGLKFDISVRFALDDGGIVSGDPNNLQDGEIVCTDSRVAGFSNGFGKWAAGDATMISVPFPECPSGPYCPEMIDYDCDMATNLDIGWISLISFDEHSSFGYSSGFVFDYSEPFAQEKYDDLEAFGFYSQPVTYIRGGTGHLDKRGGANVFCTGWLSGPVGSVAPPDNHAAVITLEEPGVHVLSVDMEVTGCFAAVVKHPLNIEDNQGFFRMYYYVHDAPAIPPVTKSVMLNVQPCE